MEKNLIFWYMINAKNKTIGELSTYVSKIMKKFNKYKKKIIIVNVNHIKFTGKKLKKKLYYKHTGYPGGIKNIKIKNLFIKNKNFLIKNSIIKMLNKNKNTKKIKKNIKLIEKVNNKNLNKKLKILKI